MPRPPSRSQRRSPAKIEADAAYARLYFDDRLTMMEIAERHGVTPGAVSRGIQRALKDVAHTLDVASLRDGELEELQRAAQLALAVIAQDHYTVSHGRVVLDANGEPIIDVEQKLRGLDRLLRIQERRAKLMGLDAPVEARIEVVTEDVIDAEIRRLTQEIDRRSLGGEAGASAESTQARS